MSFLEHLEELRWRVIRSIAAIIIAAILAFLFKHLIFDEIILAPKKASFVTYRFFCWLSQTIGFNDGLCVTTDFELQSISMSGQFSSHILVSIIAGLIIAFPYIFYQFWSFVKPGLQESEQKMSRGVVFFVTLLFLIGINFGYFLITPLSIQFFGGYQVSETVENIITLNSFISLLTSTTLACGLVFQLPMVVYFLAKVGIATPEMLRKYRKHAIVAVLVLAAIITPPDITSQILVSIPLILLYEVSIQIAKVVVRNSEKVEAKAKTKT